MDKVDLRVHILNYKMWSFFCQSESRFTFHSLTICYLWDQDGSY